MGDWRVIYELDELKKLMDDAEMLADVKAYDAAKARIERGEDELIPLEIAERRLAGESTVKIWREYRGLTHEDLAKASNVSRPTIAAIEARHKKGGIATLKKLAVALKVDLDHLARPDGRAIPVPGPQGPRHPACLPLKLSTARIMATMFSTGVRA